MLRVGSVQTVYEKRAFIMTFKIYILHYIMTFPGSTCYTITFNLLFFDILYYDF